MSVMEWQLDPYGQPAAGPDWGCPRLPAAPDPATSAACAVRLDHDERDALAQALRRRRDLAGQIYSDERADELVGLVEQLLAELTQEPELLELSGPAAHQSRRALYWAGKRWQEDLAIQQDRLSLDEPGSEPWLESERLLPLLRHLHSAAAQLDDALPPTPAAVGPRLRPSPLGA